MFAWFRIPCVGTKASSRKKRTISVISSTTRATDPVAKFAFRVALVLLLTTLSALDPGRGLPADELNA